MKIDRSEKMELLHELFIKVENSLPASLENSIFYSRLKATMTQEILKFLKEQIDLKNDLLNLKNDIGEVKSEFEIRNILDSLSKKYNLEDNNVAIIYHIESTRFDYGVPVIVIIKRDIVFVKKFVFRFKKETVSSKVGDIP